MIEITLEPDSFTPAPLSNTQSFSSSLNAFEQYAVFPGSRWSASFTWTNRRGAEARALIAQLSAISGQTETFKVKIPVSLIGTGLGTGLVNGAGQTGSEIVTDGWDASQSLLFAAGDWIEVDQAVYLITADVSSDVSGNASIPVTPPIRRSPPDGASVVVEPAFYMRAIKNNSASFNFTGAQVYATSITGREID